MYENLYFKKKLLCLYLISILLTAVLFSQKVKAVPIICDEEIGCYVPEVNRLHGIARSLLPVAISSIWFSAFDYPSPKDPLNEFINSSPPVNNPYLESNEAVGFGFDTLRDSDDEARDRMDNIPSYMAYWNYRLPENARSYSQLYANHQPFIHSPAPSGGKCFISSICNAAHLAGDISAEQRADYLTRYIDVLPDDAIYKRTPLGTEFHELFRLTDRIKVYPNDPRNRINADFIRKLENNILSVMLQIPGHPDSHLVNLLAYSERMEFFKIEEPTAHPRNPAVNYRAYLRPDLLVQNLFSPAGTNGAVYFFEFEKRSTEFRFNMR